MKKIIATVATIAFAVSLIGCGAGESSNPAGSIEVSEEDTAEEEDITDDEEETE